MAFGLSVLGIANAREASAQDRERVIRTEGEEFLPRRASIDTPQERSLNDHDLDCP